MDAKIDELIQQVMAWRDPAAKDLAIELVQAVMALHASALERIVQAAPQLLPVIAGDELVSRVLVLHGLHPDNFATRFARAMDHLERFFDSRGGRIEVLEAGPNEVRIRFSGNRPGAGTAARQAIEDAIYEAVPEVGELTVEGGEEREPGFVPLASLLANQPA